MASYDPYIPQSQLLAQILTAQRTHPVYSMGQGIADVLGDVGEAYFQKKAADKDQQTAEDNAAAQMRMLSIISNPQFSQLNAATAAGQAPAPQSAFPNGLPSLNVPQGDEISPDQAAQLSANVSAQPRPQAAFS